MFLATTASTEFWSEEERVILLGDWCLGNYDNNNLNALSYEILPYPWCNNDDKNNAYLHCCNVYENLLPVIADLLNNVFGEKNGHRYWRILIGEWMWRYIQILYDRYFCLKLALETYDNVWTTMLHSDSYRHVNDNLEFINLCGSFSDRRTHIYNLQLYSNILALLGYKFPTQKIKKENQFESRTRNNNRNNRLFRTIPKRLKELINNRLQSSTLVVYDGVFYHRESYIKEINLDVNIKIDKIRNDFDSFQNIMPQKSMRKIFKELSSSDEFEKCCLKMMEYCFPITFLEGYREIKNHISRAIKKTPKIIISSISWRFDVLSAMYISECINRGSILLGFQHGGGYGIYKLDPMLINELKVVDYFISWGWSNNNSKIIPWPAFNSDLGSKIPMTSGLNKYLFVSNSMPHYLTIFQSSPVSSTVKDYNHLQKVFFSKLHNNVRKLFIYRSYMHDYGWEQTVLKSFSEVECDDLNDTFTDKAKKSRLVVIDNNQTSFLESISLNIPTILYWDMNVWEVNDSAKHLFKELRSVSVFHDTPESAADFINNNYREIEHWWWSKEVQNSVLNFRNKYARTSNRLIAEWTEGIKTILNSI